MQQEIRGVSVGVYARENVQYSTTARTVTFVIRIQKIKSGLLCKIFHKFCMVELLSLKLMLISTLKLGKETYSPALFKMPFCYLYHFCLIVENSSCA